MCGPRPVQTFPRRRGIVAVPVVLSPITINNYGGSCGCLEPAWVWQFTDTAKPPRPAARFLKRLQEMRELDNGVKDPYFHLVDGGISDNLGLRSVLDVLETFEALHEAGQRTPLDYTRRIIIFVVNSLSKPSTQWNTSEDPPGTIDILIKTAGVPIDRYSGEMVEELKDIRRPMEGVTPDTRLRRLCKRQGSGDDLAS